MSTPRSWLPIATASVNTSDLTPRSTASVLNEFSKVGPIVAGVLGGLSAILLLLLCLRLRRKYKMRRQRADPTSKPADANGARLFRFFSKRQRNPPAYWDDYLSEKGRSKEKDVEAFPQTPPRIVSPALVAGRPLPGVPAITRASTPQGESRGAPLFPSGPQTPSDTDHALNISNPSRTKLRVRADPMIVQNLLALEEQRRQDFAGFTPARRFYFDVPPPMPGLPTADPTVPPGLEVISDGGAPVRTSSIRGPRPRSRSEPRANSSQPPTRYRSFSATVLSPIQSADAEEETALQHLSRRELRESLRETQDTVTVLEDYLSMSTIDIPPLTAHSRHFSLPNSSEHLHTEVEILRREVQRLQDLLLTARRNDSDTILESELDDPHPPPVYST